MYNYIDILEMYEAGLISLAEANKEIAYLNMGADDIYYKKIK